MARFYVLKKGDARLRGLTDNAKAARWLARELSKQEGGAHFYVKRKTYEGPMAKKKKSKKKKGPSGRAGAKRGKRSSARSGGLKRTTRTARKTVTTKRRSSASSGALPLANDLSPAGRRRLRLAKHLGMKIR